MTLEIWANFIMYLALATVAAFLALLAKNFLRRKSGDGAHMDIAGAQGPFPTKKMGILFLPGRYFLREFTCLSW